MGFTDPGLTSAHIEMNPEDLHETDGTKDAVPSHIGTLLHECVHAFIEGYTCGCRCRRLSCVEAHDFHIGKTGHALAWTLPRRESPADGEDCSCSGGQAECL